MDKKETLHTVEERLIYLHSLKSLLIPKQREWRRKYRGERIKPKNPYKSDYITNTEFSIINAKKAEILSGIQEFDFIPLDDEGYRNRPFVKNIWKYEWLVTETDKHIARAIDSSCKYGDGFIYEGTRRIVRNIKEPYIENGEIKFKDKEVVDYDGIYTEFIPWENIYFDGDTIDTANEAVWIKFWDRKDFIRSFENNRNYKNVNESLPIGRYYYIATENNGLVINPTTNIKDAEIISELRYYNKAKDQFIVLANGVEVCNMPIPYSHKELPFCKFEDYPVDGRFYSMGEYELLEEDIAFKDALRSLNIDVIKAQFGFTVIDPDADFDEATIEIGTNKFARINPKDISHFSPNINASTVIQAEQAADNDIIIKTGIDYRSQILGPGETATKTAAKTQSARKRINLNLKLNGYSFFRRLAKLRMANIKLIYGQKEKTIPMEGGSISKDGIYSPVNGGYGLFVVKPEYIKGSFNIIPITESILGVSSEREKQEFLAWLQIAGNLRKEDGRPLFNTQKLGEELCDYWGLDFEKLTEQSPIYQSPEDILKIEDNNLKGINNDNTSPQSPDYIPPEQRSGAKLSIPTISGQSNSPLGIVNG